VPKFLEVLFKIFLELRNILSQKNVPQGTALRSF